MTSPVFWIRQRNDVQGPFTKDRIEALLREHRLTETTLISTDRVNWRLPSEAGDLLGPVLVSPFPKPARVVAPAVVEEIREIRPPPLPPSARVHRSEGRHASVTRTALPHHRSKARPRRESNGLLIGGSIGILAVIAVLAWVLTRSNEQDGPTTPARSSRPKTSSTAAAPLRTRDIVAKVEGSVALIRGADGSGTGFLIGKGILATNAHVISTMQTDRMEVLFPSRSSRVYKVHQVAYLDEERDIALLLLSVGGKALPLAISYTPLRGEEVLIIGNPGMGNGQVVENAVARGLAGPSTMVDGQPFLQISASVNPGNSGGPVLNDRGEIIAMATLKAAQQEGLAFGIPAKSIHRALAVLRASSKEERSRVDTQRTAAVVFRRLEHAGTVYIVIMHAYVQGLGRALDEGVTRIAEAKTYLPDLSKQLEDIQKITGADLPLLVDDIEDMRWLDRSTRNAMVEFHQVVMRLMTKSHHPNVHSLLEFVQQFESCQQRFLALGEDIRKRLGLGEEDR